MRMERRWNQTTHRALWAMMSLDYIPKAGERHQEFQGRGCYDQNELRTSCRVEIPRRSRVDAVKPIRKLLNKSWGDKSGWWSKAWALESDCLDLNLSYVTFMLWAKHWTSYCLSFHIWRQVHKYFLSLKTFSGAIKCNHTYKAPHTVSGTWQRTQSNLSLL